MKKWLMAVALLMATKAGAATVEPTATVKLFQPPNGYLFSFGPVDPVDGSIYNAWELRVFVNDKDTGQAFARETSADPEPSLALIAFNTNETSFTVTGVLKLFVKAGVSVPGTFQNGVANIATILTETNGTTSVSTSRSVVFGAPSNLRAAPQQEPSVVPIGGTLPLMLTALGIGGLVLRMRAKAATA